MKIPLITKATLKAIQFLEARGYCVNPHWNGKAWIYDVFPPLEAHR